MSLSFALELETVLTAVQSMWDTIEFWRDSAEGGPDMV